MKKAFRSILAALTTPEAIRAEKSLAVIVLARLAITLPAYGWVLNWLVGELK